MIVVVVVCVVVVVPVDIWRLWHVLTCSLTQFPSQTLVGNRNHTHVLAVVTSDAVLTLHSLGIFTAGRGVIDPSLAAPAGTQRLLDVAHHWTRLAHRHLFFAHIDELVCASSAHLACYRALARNML